MRSDVEAMELHDLLVVTELERHNLRTTVRYWNRLHPARHYRVIAGVGKVCYIIRAA